MKYLKKYESFENKIIAYHVTNKKNLSSILKNGLEPRIPTDYGIDGDTKGIYFFKTREDMNTAVSSWFGERIEDLEEETGEEYEEIEIVVDITGLDMIDSVEFEWIVTEHISPDRIIEVIDGVYTNKQGKSLI